MQRQTDERSVDIFQFINFWEQIVGMVRQVPQKQMQRIVEQMVEVPFPHDMEEVVEEFKIAPQEQLLYRICEWGVDVSFPRDGDAGSIGETNRVGAWSEVGIKS